MLEVTYNTETKKLRAWNGDPKQFRNLVREGHTVVVLDIPVPDKDINAWLFDEKTQSLIPNPDYVEPEPPRDLALEIDDLKAEIKELKKQIKT